MDKRAEEYIKMMKNNKKKMDDTFEFGCRQCGDCCRDRHDILLPPSDLFRIARYLKMSIADLIDKYCEVYEGDNTHLPTVRALPKIYNAVCPFLRKGKCSIHPVKPSVCGLFPLGRAIDLNGTITYFIQDKLCDNGTKEKVKVSDWLKEFHIDESEEDFKIWSEILMTLAKYFKTLKKDNKIFKFASYWFFQFFYLDYDLEKPFTSQFKEKKQVAHEFSQQSLQKIRRMIEEAK